MFVLKLFGVTTTISKHANKEYLLIQSVVLPPPSQAQQTVHSCCCVCCPALPRGCVPALDIWLMLVSGFGSGHSYFKYQGKHHLNAAAAADCLPLLEWQLSPEKCVRPLLDTKLLGKYQQEINVGREQSQASAAAVQSNCWRSQVLVGSQKTITQWNFDCAECCLKLLESEIVSEINVPLYIFPVDYNLPYNTRTKFRTLSVQHNYAP